MTVRYVLLATLCATACKHTVDNKDYEKRISDAVVSLGFTPKSVACPSDIEAKVGATFVCSVEIESTKYSLNATVTKYEKDTKAVAFDTNWGPGREGEPLSRVKLVDIGTKAVAETLAAPFTIDCGPEPLLFAKANELRCKLISGAQNLTIVFKMEGANVTAWELDPKMLAKKTLETQILESVRAQTSPDVTVNCGPDELIARPADGNVPCEVGNAQATRKIRIVVTPDMKIEKWESIPEAPATPE